METEDERARLENDAATKRLRLVMETEEERKASEDGSSHTAQVDLEAEDERRNMDRIEIGVFKNFKECARSPCNGNHFSSRKGVVVGGGCRLAEPEPSGKGSGSARQGGWEGEERIYIGACLSA